MKEINVMNDNYDNNAAKHNYGRNIRVIRIKDESGRCYRVTLIIEPDEGNACGHAESEAEYSKIRTTSEADEYTIYKAPGGTASEAAASGTKETQAGGQFEPDKIVNEFRTNARKPLTFAELVGEYSHEYAANRLKQSTIDTYKTAIELYLMPAFGDMPAAALDSRIIADYLENAHFADNDKLLSYSKTRMLYYCLRSVMKFAVKKGYIDSDPCTPSVLPERRHRRDMRKKYLEDREIPKFLRLFEAYTQYNTAIRLLLYTGLRCGELLALKWGDIDFKSHTVKINRNLAFTREGYIFTSPKSEAGRRTICINKSAELLLKEHRTVSLNGRRAAPGSMVFTNKSGGYLSRQALNRALHKATKGTPFSSMSLHCLRHSNATMLINNGVELKIVAEHLGHSKISTTADIYANVTDESRRRVANTIEKKLSGRGRQKPGTNDSDSRIS